ncbi:LysR family transcriptional regulator [Paracidovorax anthurii]|uniref:LysR family transcriptional regulator n=1 Tax=Paracidovorax anthurii TaxID=78229 RepID=A0A328Z5E2_9BURK|nr:LysR family transcriptional regulator [Paracidovorax anthurii]RAR80994.1 LysR family transcriptional regulator [Paracidovorax anthurii]
MESISATWVSQLNLDQLKKFALVAELGSFTAAAERLELTQPAISQQIRLLERELGVRLLERVGRSVSPTAAGRDLLAHLPGITAAIDAAISAVSAHAADIRGRVRIGTGVTTCLYLLPDILHALRAAHPRLELIVSTGNTEDLVRRVEDNTLDLALVTLPVASPLVAATAVLEDDIVAVRAPAQPPWPERISTSHLIDAPLVMLNRGTSTRHLIDEWLLQGGALRTPTMELDSVEAIKAVVAAGLGCSLLPRMAVTGNGHHPGLELRPISPPLRRTQALVLRNDKPLSSALRTVVDAIAAAG